MKLHYWLLLIIAVVAAFFRLYKLNENPPALYWDEASLGYNAYAILTTGHDEHGEKFPITRFIAFGDYKPPGYIYATAFAMAIFGVNEFAIRLPSALSGVGMVILTYFLASKVTKDKNIGLVSASLLAVSPWSLQLSRAAFEAHLAALFNVAAILSFLGALRKKWLFPISTVFFVLTFYTFNANRILAPLFMTLLVIVYWREVWLSRKWLIVSLFLGAILLLPNLSYFQSRESRLRFQEVSIFTSLDTVKKANARIERSGNNWWSKLLHNRRVYFTREFLYHYVDHFKGEFLFIKGDRNPRLSTQDVGELYLFELPFLLMGLFIVLKLRNKTTALLFGWLLLAPIPAAMARETPHMLRIASILPTFQIFTGVGLVSAWNLLKQKKVGQKFALTLIFSIASGVTLIYYFHNYWIHYPLDWSGEWQYGYKQMVEKVSQLESKYDRISITSSLGRPYIYFLFYKQVNPLDYVFTRRAERDWFGLWNVYGFGKYDFTESPVSEGERVLKISTAGSIDPTKKIAEIRAPDGRMVFEIGEP